MKKELWLEYGVIHRDQNNYHDVIWYNEGNANEFSYWVKHLLKNLFNKKYYHLLRYGKIKIEV